MPAITRKINLNANGWVEIRKSTDEVTDELVALFDPSGMFVTDHPRAEECVLLSKTPSNQDENEGIAIAVSSEDDELLIYNQSAESFNPATTKAEIKEALALLFTRGGGSGVGATDTAIGVYKAFVYSDGTVNDAIEIVNTIGTIDLSVPSGGELDFESNGLFVEGKTAVIIGNNYNGGSGVAYPVNSDIVHCSGFGVSFYIEIKIYP